MNKNSIKYDEKIIAFLDILGFEKLVLESTYNPHIISRIVNILTRSKYTAGTFLKFRPNVLQVDPGKYMYRAFSDTVIISAPYTSTDDLNFLFWWVIQYQYLMWKEEQTFIRGAIIFGKIYETQEVLFGPALIDAYHMERFKAVWPRVLVNSNVINKTTDEEKKGILSKVLKYDGSFIYLDYLHELFHLFVLAENKRISGENIQDSGTPLNLLSNHKKAILKQYEVVIKEKDPKKREILIKKYRELSRYHNSTIDNILKNIDMISKDKNLISAFINDQKSSLEAESTGKTYKRKFYVEEHPEQSDMLDILVAVQNILLGNLPQDIFDTLGVIFPTQTQQIKLDRIFSTLIQETPQKLVAYNNDLKKLKIPEDIFNLGFKKASRD